MRLLSRLGLASSLVALSFSAFVPLASADHVSDVLGESTSVSEINFPGLAAGPGFILPDSSLYPLDQMVQELRLILAFTPEQQAQVHMRILGERLGETKVMMQRDNQMGIEIALSGAENAARGAARSLGDAAAKGRTTASLARDMNRTLAEYRTALREVASQAPLSLASRIDATSYTLLEAKMRVEDELPGDELASAIDGDLEEMVDTQVLGVKIAANNLMQKYNSVEARSKFNAEQKMKYEEMMASKSGMKKEQIEQKKKMLEENSEARAKLLEERKEIIEQIKELIQKLQENQKAIQQLQQAQNGSNDSGNNSPMSPTPTPGESGAGIVTGVTAEVTPSSLTKSCPAIFTFRGTITTNSAGTVQYRWYRSDGATGPVQSIQFTEAGSKTFTTTWTLGANTSSRFQPFNGWEAVKIISPNQMTSNQASFSLTCQAS